MQFCNGPKRVLWSTFSFFKLTVVISKTIDFRRVIFKYVVGDDKERGLKKKKMV